MPRHLFIDGMPLVEESIFNANRPYTGCLICGRLFQTDKDRSANTLEEQVNAMAMRKLWSRRHSKTHSNADHARLKLSGLMCTPEAAEAFQAYGIISISDMILSDEHEDALLKAKPIIVKEVETKVVL